MRVDGTDQTVERQLVGEVPGAVEDALPEPTSSASSSRALAVHREALGDLEQLVPDVASGPLRAQPGDVDADPRAHLKRRREQWRQAARRRQRARR